MWRAGFINFSTYIWSEPKYASLSLFTISKFSINSASFWTILKPFPPPPCAAFKATGYPKLSASFIASRLSLDGLSWPGTGFKPNFETSFLDSILSPIELIVSGFGPIQTIPFFWIAFAKSAFSARNPYPGWTKSAFVSVAAFTSFFKFL